MKSEFFTWDFIDFYGWIFPFGLWNCHLLTSLSKTSKLCVVFRYSSAMYQSFLQQLLTFQCKSDGNYWNECLREQHRATVSDSQKTQADLVELMTSLCCFENIFFSGPGELQDWDSTKLIMIWEVMWGFLCHVIRKTSATSGNVKWGVKGSLSLDSLPHNKLVLNCGRENCPYFSHQPNFEACKDKQDIASQQQNSKFKFAPSTGTV